MMLGLKPKCSPLQWISKPAFAEDGVFGGEEVVRFDVGRSAGTRDEECGGACSGVAILWTMRVDRTSKLHGNDIMSEISGGSLVQLSSPKHTQRAHVRESRRRIRR